MRFVCIIILLTAFSTIVRAAESFTLDGVRQGPEFEKASASFENVATVHLHNHITQFGDNAGHFIGLIFETPQLSGHLEELARGDYDDDTQDELKTIYHFNIQHREDYKILSLRNGVRVVSRRTVVNEGRPTIAYNEEFVFLPNKQAYSLTFVSNLSDETKAIKARDGFRSRFESLSGVKTASVFEILRPWLEVPRAWGQASRELGRTQGGGTPRGRVNPNAPAPECLNVGIRDRRDIRPAGQSPAQVSVKELVDSCGAGIEPLIKGFAMSALPSENMYWTRVFGIRGTQTDDDYVATFPVSAPLNMIEHTITGVIGLVRSTSAKLTDWFSANRGNIRRALIAAMEKKKKQVWTCLSNNARMKLICEASATVASMVGPAKSFGGAVARMRRAVNTVAEDGAVVTARNAPLAPREPVPPPRVASTRTPPRAPKPEVQPDIVVTGRRLPTADALVKPRSRIPCVAATNGSAWDLLIPRAFASPCSPTNAVSYEKAWRAADRADERATSLLGDFREQLSSGRTAEAMNSLREAQQAAREAGRAFDQAAQLGKSPKNYQFAMENYIAAGDAEAAAASRLAAVRTLGESPAAVATELRTAIQKLQANPKTATDVMLTQRLGVLRSTLQRFEQGSQQASAAFAKSGETRAVSPTVTRNSARNLTEPAPSRTVAPTNQPPTVPQVAPQAARAPTVSNVTPRRDPFLAMSDSLKADGNQAVSMVREAVESKSPERINSMVEDLDRQRVAEPTPNQRAALLRSVQEIRRLDATGSLTTGNLSRLESLERGLIEPARNPAALAQNGKVAETVAVFRERLANGWPQNVVKRDIQRQIDMATSMRRAILDGAQRQAARNPRLRPPPVHTEMWDRIINTNTQVLRELGQ